MGADALIASFLEIAFEDLDAGRVLAKAGNRNAAFHYQQAAEKVIRAVLTSESIHARREHQHLLQRLVDLVPDANPVKPLLRAVEHLSTYATTFRYPAEPSGRTRPSPSAAELQQDDARVEGLSHAYK